MPGGVGGVTGAILPPRPDFAFVRGWVLLMRAVGLLCGLRDEAGLWLAGRAANTLCLDSQMKSSETRQSVNQSQGVR
jgi:hypothetical protein